MFVVLCEVCKGLKCIYLHRLFADRWLEAGAGPDPVKDEDKSILSDYFSAITESVSGEDNTLRQVCIP